MRMISTTKARKWSLSSYTTTILQQSSIEPLQRVSTISREAAIRQSDGAGTNKEVIPLILTYNSTNIHIKTILTKNFELFKSDPETMEIFRSSRVLGAYRRDSNLKDSLVHSNLQFSMNSGGDSNGTFPCHRPRCKTCAYTNSTTQINTPGGRLTIRQKFACTSSNLIYIITCRTCTLCYIGEIGRRRNILFRSYNFLFCSEISVQLAVLCLWSNDRVSTKAASQCS